MRLITHTLEDVLRQEITVGVRPMMLAAIRPHILVFNHAALAGTLQVQIQDARGRKVAVSETLNLSVFSTLAYAHKYYRFYIDAALRAGATYQVALVSGGGYSFSEAAYVGWCNGWEFRQNASYSPANGLNAPLDFELWERKDLFGRRAMPRVLDFSDGYESSTPPSNLAVEASSSGSEPTIVTAGGGITVSVATAEDQYVSGSGGVTITANPQISAGSYEGQVLNLIGTSDDDWVELVNDNGLQLNGPCKLTEAAMISLRWNASAQLWMERFRNGVA